MNTEMATLTGAYVVDALPGSERARFERHLAECEECQQEVAELRETAVRLGRAVEASPPDELKQRVLAEVGTVRQDAPRAQESRTGVRGRARRKARSWTMGLATAAAIIGIALASVFGVLAWRAQQDTQQAQQQMQEASGRGEAMAAVLQAPDARMASAPAGSGKATVVASRTMDKALFIGSKLPQLPQQRGYQLWFMGPAGPSSAGMLTRDSGGQLRPTTADMPPDTTQMAMTVEPAGGSPQPTSTPMMLMPTPA